VTDDATIVDVPEPTRAYPRPPAAGQRRVATEPERRAVRKSPDYAKSLKKLRRRHELRERCETIQTVTLTIGVVVLVMLLVGVFAGFNAFIWGL
jgi:hypothetical protein